MHDREMIVRLQTAHADHIEAIYLQRLQVPGNPDGIEILKIGETRIFLSNKNRLENRAIFTGNETLDTLREVTACFDRKGVYGFFEINPANFYPSSPFSWEPELLPALLGLGYQINNFRCVWVLDSDHPYNQDRGSIQIRQFTAGDVEAYIEAKLQVEPVDADQIEQEKQAIQQEFTSDWAYFAGYQDGKPVSVSKLFITKKIGYLAWGYTAKEYRRKGHHRAHVLSRTSYAFEQGCEVAFSVTDFNVPSSISLQKVGFKLAYNYLMVELKVKRT